MSRLETRLNRIARKTRFETVTAEEDVCNLLFDYQKTREACRIFLKWLKANGGSATRHEVSQFGRDLEAGIITENFKYSRRSFYRGVLRRLVQVGFIELDTRFERGKRVDKYCPIYQPIPSRPPGRRNFWHLAWQICEKWNQEWKI